MPKYCLSVRPKHLFYMNKLLLLAGLLLLAPLVHAQDDPGSGGPDPAAVPLDGGSALLLTTGVGYGLRKLQQLRRRR